MILPHDKLSGQQRFCALIASRWPSIQKPEDILAMGPGRDSEHLWKVLSMADEQTMAMVKVDPRARGRGQDGPTTSSISSCGDPGHTLQASGP